MTQSRSSYWANEVNERKEGVVCVELAHRLLTDTAARNAFYALFERTRHDSDYVPKGHVSASSHLN